MVRKISLILLLCAVTGCLGKNIPTDEYQIIYPQKYFADPPTQHWQRMESSRDLSLFSPQLVNIYFKKDTGSIILLRAGRKPEYGVPPEYDLTRAEMVYLIKFIPHGSFDRAEESKLENKLWEKAEKIFRYHIEDHKFGAGKMLGVITQRREILLGEFFTPATAPAEDEAEFYQFLNSLQERNEEDESFGSWFGSF
ncbi:MAG: hypothetical protein HZA78_05510 [Candidatus Schekmanbacteria bacterium]|nr:hypothetical protein [Candidatus Schekmanbacteria bacterium]